MSKSKTSRVIRNWCRRCGTALVIGTVMAGCGSFMNPDRSLVDELRAAQSAGTGVYPDFIDQPSPSGDVDLGGDRRESLTPRFPSRLQFELEVPPFAFLEFAPALIMVQDVRRARVEFRILVGEGSDAVTAYSEVLRADEANRWHDREVDLSRWARRAVRLTVETRAVPPRGAPLWAERVRPVWGAPVLGPRPGKVAVARVTAWAGETLDWLVGRLEAYGISPDRQALSMRFAVNLLVGGLLSVGIRELYKRCAQSSSGSGAFANMLPLFTLATITVISVVQYSPALALGLVGALSVIRFRAAIASGEELVFLLLCVGLGVAIGANHVFLAGAAVVVVTPFIVLRPWISGSSASEGLVLTIAAEPASFFAGDGWNVLDVVGRLTKEMAVERLDQGSERIFLRARIFIESETQLVELLAALRSRVSECQVSRPQPEPS